MSNKQSFSFNEFTPLYHKQLDDWGIAKGTLVWHADGSFVPVEELQAGDYIFGITYKLEDDWLPLDPNRSSINNVVKIWRPSLTMRQVLEVSTVEARAWQLTFGAAEKQSEARRLVAGADTTVSVFPLSHDRPLAKRLVDLHTSVVDTNPRMDPKLQEGMQLDVEWSRREGRAMYRPTPYTGTPVGDMATIIPYEAYGGQAGLLRADIRSYNRYLFSQVREVIPVKATTELYQLKLVADTKPEYGIGEGDKPRSNMICQTPFSDKKKKRKVISDYMSAEVAAVQDVKDFEKRWDEWNTDKPQITKGKAKIISSTSQGMYYDSKNDPKLSAGLEKYYGKKQQAHQRL